jgi:hypothetical protein
MSFVLALTRSGRSTLTPAAAPALMAPSRGCLPALRTVKPHLSTIRQRSPEPRHGGFQDLGTAWQACPIGGKSTGPRPLSNP